MMKKTKNTYKAVVAFAVAMAFVMPGAAVGSYLENTMNQDSTSLSVDDAIIDLQSFEKDAISRNTKSADVPYSTAITIPEDPTSDEQDYWVSPEQARASRNIVLREYGISEEKILTMTDEEAMNLRNSLTTTQERTGGMIMGTLDPVDWWPEENHDAANTAYTTATAPDLYNATLLWKKNLGGRTEGSTPVVDGKIITASKDKPPIYCLNASTGEEIWNYSAALSSSPAIVGGRVYATVGSRIVCLNFSTGALIWMNSESHGWTPPAVVGNRIYYGGYNNNYADTFYCIRTTDGTEIWNVTLSDVQYSNTMNYGSPAIANDKVYFGTGRIGLGPHKLYCYDINGNHIWNVTTPGEAADTSPTVVNGKVYISNGDLSGSHTLCYNATTGNLVWSHSAEDAFGYRGVAVANGLVYAKELLTLYCLYAENGTEKWSYNYQEYGGCNGAGPSVTADGKVYVQKDSYPVGTPNLICLDANTGAYLGGFLADIGEIRGTPVVANGKIYIQGRDNNHIYCLGEVDHDIIPLNIDSPVSGPEPGTFTPEVTIRNQGRSNETDVPVTMKITNIYRYLYEDFDSVIWPPAGWTEEQPNEWRKSQSNNAGGQPPEEFLLPIIYLIGTTAWIQSPARNTSAATELTLEFKCKLQGFVPNQASAYVYVRANASQPWTNVAPWPNPLNGNTYGAAMFQINITPYIGTGTQVRFEYTGAKQGSTGWYIDDVSIMTPGETPEYNETVNVDILSKETMTTTFPEWTPTSLYYIVDVDTDLQTDEVTWNDMITEVVTFHYYDDLAVLGINAPLSGPASVITPEVQVGNFGSFNMTNQSVNLKIGEPQPTFLEEDFSNLPFPPTGWTVEEPNEWQQNPSNSAGGKAPEARLSSSVTGNYASLQSPPVDTTAVSELTLKFKSYIYNKYGGYNCSIWVRKDTMHLWVEVTPWSNPIAGNVPPTAYNIDITPYIGTGTQVRFEFDGNASCLRYWYLDDVVILKVIPLEYDETVLINITADNVMTVVFPDWMPEYFNYDYSGSIDYEVTAYTSVAGDEFPENDQVVNLITLDFLHDAAVKNIAEPVWEYFHNGYANNGVGLTSGGTYEAAMRLTPSELQNYDGGKINAVKFYHHETGSHSGQIKIYAEGTSGSAGSLITSEPYTVTGKGWYEVTLSSPVTINAEEDLWVSVEITHSAGQYPIGIDNGPAVDGKGDWIYINGGWEEIQYGGLDKNWCIESQLEKNVEWEPGTYPIDAVITNYGTYDESNFNVNAKIWLILDKDWILYYESNHMVTTIMQPGDELNVVFNDVVFGSDDIGDYRLEITTELPGDDDNTNDQCVLLFKVVLIDHLPPETTHEFSGTIGDNNWYISDVTLVLTASDPTPPYKRFNSGKGPSGVNHTYYKIDSGAWTEYTTPVIVSTDGQHQVSYYSVDMAGNTEPTKGPFNFKMDKTSPQFTGYTFTPLNLLKNKWLCVADVTDATSGVVRVEFYVDDALVGNVTTTPYEFEFDGNPTNKSQALAYDAAGNSALSPIAQYVELDYQVKSDPTMQFLPGVTLRTTAQRSE
ncbi:MAG TPA: PQQ-binding-like beta-propeller repeat protein [Candidatus Thermoplasmatota archaeon]|nr:PQQ-binding-like beta-propeller repeat protein [Candidatus Thermoplasmatota archaeon]